MKQFIFSLGLLFASSLAIADSDIYVCTDAHGVKMYGNTGDNKGCKKVDLPGLTTFPAPTSLNKKNSKAPGNFPKVDNFLQKKRDEDRRQILDDELKGEQKKLEDIRAQYNNGTPDRLGSEHNYARYQERTDALKEDLNRTQKNIEALQREINGLN